MIGSQIFGMSVEEAHFSLRHWRKSQGPLALGTRISSSSSDMAHAGFRTTQNTDHTLCLCFDFFLESCFIVCPRDSHVALTLTPASWAAGSVVSTSENLACFWRSWNLPLMANCYLYPRLGDRMSALSQIQGSVAHFLPLRNLVCFP